MTMDVTFDLETCALCPSAAVMSIAAIVWDRNKKFSPFCEDEKGNLDFTYVYMRHIDLRSQFVKGFVFDKQTADWWAAKSDAAKAALLGLDDVPLMPIEEVVRDFFTWIEETRKELKCEDVCLWSQGSDFDIAILRNICHKFNIEIPIKHKNFRDHRTFFLEGARMICELTDTEFDHQRAYSLVEPYEGEGVEHAPDFDCKQSIYSTWQMMKHLKCLMKKA